MRWFGVGALALFGGVQPGHMVLHSLGGTLGQGHQAGCCGPFIEMNPQGICEKGRALDLWTLCAVHGSRLSVSSGVLRGRSRSGFGALSAVVYLGNALHGCENISFE